MTTELDSGMGSENSDGEASESSIELPEALAIGREKRQTAGNRLRDMLNAELESEAIFAEDEEDEDFGSDQEKQEDHDSELDSSSEDDNVIDEGDDAGEKVLKQQEKHAARVGKRKALGHMANPTVIKRAASRQTKDSSTAALPRKKPKLQHERLLSATRQSARAHAVGIAAEVEKRLHEEATKKSKTVRITKVDDPILSQADRLAEAKITEEQNIASLNKIVQYEEEKKANRKLLNSRRRALGPLVRIISTTREPLLDDVKSTEGPQVQDSTELMEDPSQDNSLLHPMDQINRQEILPPKLPKGSSDAAILKVKSVRTYISFDNLPYPVEAGSPADRLITDFMGPLLGSKSAYPDKPICMFSGLPGRYFDPETGVRYGNLRAYKMLQEIKTGTTPWNPQLKMYVPREE